MPTVERFTRESMKPLLEPYGLCEAVRAGSLLTLGGQTGIDHTHQVVSGGLKAQALQAFRNIREIVEFAGGRAENMLHFTWYLVEGPEVRGFLEDAIEVTAAREEIFPGLCAGATAVRVKALLTPELLVEIQATAAI
jgi:enamine deaminase RidA (YjgF/YER057c/UK114 family)